MPPKRHVKQTAAKPRAKAAGAASKKASSAPVKVAATRNLKASSTGRPTSTSTHTARGRSAAVKSAAAKRKTTAPPASKPRSANRASDSKVPVKPQPKAAVRRSGPLNARSRRQVARTKCAKEEDSDDEKTCSSEAGDQISSGATETPAVMNDVEDDASDGGDFVLLHSSSELATDTAGTMNESPPQAADIAPSKLLALDGSSDATMVILSTPSKTDTGERRTHHPCLAHPQRGGEDEKKHEGEESRSGEESPEVLTADSESRRSRHCWRHHFTAKDNTNEVRREGGAVKGEGTVKQLFACPQRLISYSPHSSHASSPSPTSSSSASRVFIDDKAADRTLPMGCEEEELQNGHRATNTVQRAWSRDDVSCSSLSSSFDSSVFHDPPLPGSPTADTPPPPLAPLRKDGASMLAPHSADCSLLGGPTQLSTVQAWSSSSAPLLLMDQGTDNVLGDVSKAGANPRNDDACNHPELQTARYDVSPSPQPKAEEATVMDHTNATSVQHPSETSDVSSRPPVQQAHCTNQCQQQQHTPFSTGGRLRMGGSVSRARSPSTSTARLSYGWLKKVNAGVEAPHQQHQQSQHTHSSSPYSTPPTACLPATQECEGEQSKSNSVGHSGSSSPLRWRSREPPTWRSPQPTHFPKSLNVSPSSVCPGRMKTHNDTRLCIVGYVLLDFSPASQTTLLPAVVPQSHFTAGPASAVAQRERSCSNSSASTAILTQTPTQASASASNANTDAQVPTAPAQPSSASATVSSSSGAAAGIPGQGMATSRPSTQLITKAAATRPTASPATMWICLDDDDEEEEQEVEGRHGGEAGEKGKAAMVRRDAVAAAAPAKATEVSAGSYPQRTRERFENAAISRETKARAEAQRRRLAEKSHPISEILSPTFRPRRRAALPFPAFSHSERVNDNSNAAHINRAPPTSETTCETNRDPHRFFIQLDDASDEEDEEERDSAEEGEAPPRKRARLSEFPSLCSYPPAERPINTASASPAAARSSLNSDARNAVALIMDDDSDTDEEEGQRPQRKPAVLKSNGSIAATVKADRAKPVQARRPSIRPPGESDDSQANSPLKPTVKDLFFPKRLDPEARPSIPLYESIHAYQQLYQEQQQQQQHADSDTKMRGSVGHSAFDLGDSVTHALVSSGSTAMTRPPQGQDKKNKLIHESEKKNEVKRGTTAWNDSPGHKRARASTGGAKAPLAPILPDWGRPADALLRDFFPHRYTKKNFMEAAQTVMSPMHFLEPNDFWEAFTAAEFVGEGSFGLVWRCRTVDGDVVAVKSCPILLRTKANIEDSFSAIREIATMRFLNEMQVPYILPLHSAFFAAAAEALPPLAQEALTWRRQLRKRAEAAVLEYEVRLLEKGHFALSKRGGGKRSRRGSVSAASAAVAAAAAANTPLTFEQQVEAQLQRQMATETPEEKAARARLQGVRLPQFLSITEDDLRQSDATAFLVMELCDGDVEGIPRSDGVVKGVAYCVSSALAAMHELGLLHLDVKPSNVLVAYEHGLSQPSSAATAPPHPNVDAVKFYLSDLGNCRLVGPDPLAEVAESYGTFEYMDLRALQDAVCGRPTDAFSLGATLYALLYGKRLYPKCSNPKCAEEEDHSRECFVEAAKKPVVLPTTALPPASAPGCIAAAAEGDSTTSSITAVPPPQRQEVKSSSMKGSDNSRSTTVLAHSTPALTPLQFLTLALLRQHWAERMTAAACRRYLIDTFHITQTDEVEENEEGEAQRPQAP